MGEYRTPPDIVDTINRLRERLSALETTRLPPQHTAATRPTAPTSPPVKGLIIFVTDAAAGSKFQGWDGTSWVSLG